MQRRGNGPQSNCRDSERMHGKQTRLPALLSCFSGQGPQFLDCFLGVEALWAGFTARVRPVPAWTIGNAGTCQPAAGHLEMTVGVGFLDPLPGVAEPVVALFLGHEGEPRDFVPAPNERGLARLAGI